MEVKYGIVVDETFRVLAECNVELSNEEAINTIAADYMEFRQLVKETGCETFIAIDKENDHILPMVTRRIEEG